jgi:hypothetical protein
MKLVSYREYKKLCKLPVYSSEVDKILFAYSDCIEGVDLEGVERDLDFFSTEPYTVEAARAILKAAIPNGYNDFEVDKAFDQITDMFGTECHVHIARESSVCIYIKPTRGTVWFSRKDRKPVKCDELSFVSHLGMFRLWWD